MRRERHRWSLINSSTTDHFISSNHSSCLLQVIDSNYWFGPILLYPAIDTEKVLKGLSSGHRVCDDQCGRRLDFSSELRLLL